MLNKKCEFIFGIKLHHQTLILRVSIFLWNIINHCFLESVFLICYLAAPRPTLGHCQGDSLTNPMLITVFLILISTWSSPWTSWRDCVLKPGEHLVVFEPEASDSECNALNHQATPWHKTNQRWRKENFRSKHFHKCLLENTTLITFTSSKDVFNQFYVLE